MGRRRAAERLEALNAPTKGERRTHWALVELRNIAGTLIAGAASVVFTLWTVQVDMWTRPGIYYGWIAASIVVLWFAGYFWFLTPRYSHLAKAKAAAEEEAKGAQKALQDALDTSLAHLAAELKRESSDYRVSAYSVEDDGFVLLSRHSKNPELEQRGRPVYPLTKGVIGEAWRRGSSYRTYDVKDRAEWEAALVATGDFSAEVAAGMTMMARSILGVRVDLSTTSKVGMVVIESTQANAFEQADADKMRRRGLFSAIANIIGWHEHFPRARDWHDERDGKETQPRLDEPTWKAAPQVPSLPNS